MKKVFVEGAVPSAPQRTGLAGAVHGGRDGVRPKPVIPTTNDEGCVFDLHRAAPGKGEAEREREAPAEPSC